MDIIDNAWLVPLSRGGIYKIVFCDNEIKIIRIFSGEYVQEKIKFKNDLKYIDSINVPGATDPIEPEELYNNIKDTINYITDEYYKEEKIKSESSNDIKIIKYNDIENIELKTGNSRELPELIINDNKFILPHKNFDIKHEMDKDLYSKYNKMIKKYINKKYIIFVLNLH